MQFLGIPNPQRNQKYLPTFTQRRTMKIPSQPYDYDPPHRFHQMLSDLIVFYALASIHLLAPRKAKRQQHAEGETQSL